MTISSPHFSRRTAGKAQILWIIFLGLTIGFGVLKTFPSFTEWQTARQKVQTLTVENKQLEALLVTEKIRKQETQNAFNTAAEKQIADEKQFYPKKIDTNKIAEVLEIYSINETIVNGRTPLSITNLTFSSGGKKQSATQTTRTSISIDSDRNSLRSFVKFLQTSELPETFEKAKVTHKISTSEYQFLKNQLLPVCLIDSIKSTPQKKDDPILKTTIQLRFFSQG